LTDKVKAHTYLQEFQKLYPEDPEGQVFFAEVLIDRKEKAEAKKLLEKAAASDQEYHASLAKKLLKDL
jgi:predicted Zn-dependent protease